jgi:hypothetical protein
MLERIDTEQAAVEPAPELAITHRH